MEKARQVGDRGAAGERRGVGPWWGAWGEGCRETGSCWNKASPCLGDLGGSGGMVGLGGDGDREEALEMETHLGSQRERL